MSKSALRNAYYTIGKTIDRANLSYQSINDYKQILRSAFKTLNDDGYILRSLFQLKRKHIRHLIQHWQSSQLNPGTIKNRLAVFRLTADIMRKPQLVQNNQAYGIESRQYIPKTSKGIHHVNLDVIKNDYVKASLELQRLFGLRREEAIKFKPHQADLGVAIELQASWTKGGIQRLVPIITQEQRDCLNRLKVFVPKGHSLIPEHLSYKQQRIQYDNHVQQVGLKNPHGLRHAYAQNRYEVLTQQLSGGKGWKAPILGGPARTALKQQQAGIDTEARRLISQELGHSRIAITKSYLG